MQFQELETSVSKKEMDPNNDLDAYRPALVYLTQQLITSSP